MKGSGTNRSPATTETRNYVSKTRDDLQKKLIDDEGLPLVYSQEGI